MNILRFKMFKMSIGCKILVLLLIESPREFELAERNFISHFSIGQKGARDDGIHLVGRLVTSASQPTNMAGDFARDL